jgi:hypothetical protein
MDQKLKIACQLAKITRSNKDEGYFVWRSEDKGKREEKRIANNIEKVIK